MRQVTILGSTGSIGTQALEVIEEHATEFSVSGLAAGSRMELLAAQIMRHRPERVAVSGPAEAERLRSLLEPGVAPEIRWGEQALVELAAQPADVVLVAVVGARGLAPTLAALEAGRTVALANKESLVCGGGLVKAALARGRGRLVPVDSEHSGLFQCLHGVEPAEVARIVLTASGGAFRGRRPEDLGQVTPEEALAHPTWRMGTRVTIDSATLMNKGLEIIEAHWLFGVDFGRIGVVVHPASIVHALVEMVDGTVLAHLGRPDMRLPIQYALFHPERRASRRRAVDLAEVGSLSFEPVRWESYPCLRLAVEAGAAGGSWPVVLNAADEVAVEAFVAGRLAFPGIAGVVAAVLDRWRGGPVGSLEEVAEVDRWARRTAVEVIEQA